MAFNLSLKITKSLKIQLRTHSSKNPHAKCWVHFACADAVARKKSTVDVFFLNPAGYKLFWDVFFFNDACMLFLWHFQVFLVRKRKQHWKKPRPSTETSLLQSQVGHIRVSSSPRYFCCLGSMVICAGLISPNLAGI